MNSVQNVTVTSNALTYKKKSINRRVIHKIEYANPKNIVWAIISNVAKYIVLMVFVIGIPICIYVIYKDVKSYRVIVTLQETDRKGKAKVETFYMTKEEHDFIKENY
jgi:hypothetical protein